NQGPRLGCGISNHLAYDPVNSVFLYVGGWPIAERPAYAGYPCAVYAFKYQGKDAAKATPAANEPAPVYDLKSLPKGTGEWSPLGSGVVTATGGWSVRPSMATTGSELLLAVGEYPPPTKDHANDYCEIHAFRYSGGQWAHLGNGTASTKGEVQAQTPSVSFDSA